MSRINIYISITATMLFAVMGCNPVKQVQVTPEAENPRPTWVESRPLSGAYYIGVGSASKTAEPLEYAGVAKQNALNDLASEISINIEGESFLNTMETNYIFSEEFNSNIKTTISEKLEGYEIMGSWEDGDEYWIYYRLNQADHARIKAEKKAEAVAIALDFFEKASEAKDQRKVRKSVQLHTMALLELKEYWNETTRATWNDEEVFLENEIYSSLLGVVNGLDLNSPMTKVVLQASNSFEVNVPFSVTLDGEPASDVPVFYDYERINYKRPQGVYTDADGLGSALIQNISRFEQDNRVELQIDKEVLFEGVDDKILVKALEKQLTAERLSMPISMVLPKIMVSSEERKFDKLNPNRMLAQTTKAELSRMGFILTNDPNKADYLIKIEANSSMGGTTQGFHVAWLNMNMCVSNLEDHIIYESTETGVKGLQLNFGSASDEAYNKAAQKIKREWVPNLLEMIL